MYNSLLIFSLPMSTEIDDYTMGLSLKGCECKLFKCGPVQINSLLPELSLPQTSGDVLFNLIHTWICTYLSSILYM